MKDLKVKEGAVTCGMNEILFPVQFIENSRKTNREYSRVVVGTIDGEEMDLNYCSPRYALVPNAEIFPEIEDILTLTLNT
jgi:hypothetical protein